MRGLQGNSGSSDGSKPVVSECRLLDFSGDDSGLSDDSGE
jgi:hypothetical protein